MIKITTHALGRILLQFVPHRPAAAAQSVRGGFTNGVVPALGRYEAICAPSAGRLVSLHGCNATCPRPELGRLEASVSRGRSGLLPSQLSRLSGNDARYTRCHGPSNRLYLGHQPSEALIDSVDVVTSTAPGHCLHD